MNASALHTVPVGSSPWLAAAVLAVAGLLLAGSPAVAAGKGEPVAPGLFRLAGSDPTLSHDDLEPLRKVIGNARLVGLGEAVHTSGGFYEMKHRLFRFLVEEMGFRAFGFETPWLPAETVASYVDTCEGSPEEALGGLFRVMRSEEVRDLAVWMCEWNREHPKDRVHFYGFDIQRPQLPSAEHLIAFLERLGVAGDDPRIEGIRACDGVAETYFPFRPYPAEAYERCQGALTEIESFLDDNERDVVRRSSPEELGWARVHLVTLQSGQELFFYLRSDFPRAYAARDLGMAYVAAAIRELRFPHAKVALWAANGHVARDGLGSFELESMGTFLTEVFGRSYVTIALVAHVMEIDWPFGLGCGPFQYEPNPDPVEEVLFQTGEEYLLLDLDPRGGHPAFLEPGVAYSVGGAFMVPALHFDALVYLERSPPMVPTDRPPC